MENSKLPVLVEADLMSARHIARSFAKAIGFGIVDETKLVTAVSELSRNLLVHGGGGVVEFQQLEQSGRQGVRVFFEDHGPGISDIALAMTDGHSTTNSMGLGLPGSKRLVNEFEIKSEIGKGTRVTIIKWK